MFLRKKVYWPGRVVSVSEEEHTAYLSVFGREQEPPIMKSFDDINRFNKDPGNVKFVKYVKLCLLFFSIRKEERCRMEEVVQGGS